MSELFEAQLERAVAWYPGHMVAAMRRMGEALALVDVIVETIDARLPRSGANPLLNRLAAGKQRVVVLTRSDLADPATTRGWLEAFARRGVTIVALNARDQRGAARLSALLAARTTKKTSRAMVVGIPNSGKSSIVNGLLQRAAAKVENRAGVTRRTQWFRVSPRTEVMDTPGVLVPKIASKSAQWKLAAVGAVPSARYDPQEVARNLERWAARHGARRVPQLDSFAAERGFVRRGGKVDEHNAAQSYLRAFESGKFGRVSLESPDDAEAT